MIQLTITLTPDDLAALERDGLLSSRSPVELVELMVSQRAREVRAREAVARSDEPCCWREPYKRA